MRFLGVLLLFVFIFGVPYTSLAQEDTLDSKTIKAQQKNSDSPFARASDKQIAEAQRYYKECKNNETLSKRKDCRCAATSYLETKLRLGEKATSEQILAENINKCLKDEKNKIEDFNKIDLEGVTEKQIAEAEQIQKWCETTPKIRNENDCECVAAKFLEIRINDGPIIAKDEVLSRIITPALCKNVVESTGVAYSRCMTQSDLYYRGIEPKKYCECFARKWAEYYENHTGKLGPLTKGNYEYYSRMYCLKPSSYK